MAQESYSVWCVGPARHNMDYGFDREAAIAAWNTRADLSAELVRAGLEAAAKYHDEIYEHDASGIEHSSMVGIAISNRAELEQSCRRAEMNAREIRAMASDPEVIAAIVARVTEGK